MVAGRCAMSERPIHALSIEEVFAVLSSRADGLFPDEIARSLREHGPNTLAPPPRFAWLRLLVKPFVNLFSLLLLSLIHI